MQNSEPLYWYGIVIVAVCGALIIIPYWRRKTDLLTAWNVILLSIAIFVGLGCLEAATSNLRQPELQWFRPTKLEVIWYLLYTSVFLATLWGVYYYFPVGKRLAGNCLVKWPEPSTPLYLSVIGFCFFVHLLSAATMGNAFVGAIVFKLSHKSLAFATVFAFALWWRRKGNLFWFAFFCLVFIFACLTSMQVGLGRRLLLSIFVGPLLCVYWIQARYWPPKRTLSIVCAASIGILVIGLMYSSIRHFSHQAGQLRQARTTGAIVQQIRNVGDRPWLERFMRDKLFFFGQQSVHYSFLVKRHVDDGRLITRPLNSLLFAVCYPIPRQIWTNKPVPLATTSALVIARTRSTNWGTGIAGHGAYEGGIPVLILYAALLAIGIRFFDEPMKKQPNNPFLIGMLTAASPHLLGWARGDIVLMALDAAECVLFAVILGIVCRIVFGTERKHLGSPSIRATDGYRLPYAPSKFSSRVSNR